MKLRRATSDDLRFVAASWYDDYWKRWGRKHSDRKLFHAGQGARIDRLLAHCDTFVAYLPEVPDEVLGWLVIDLVSDVVHYCYVKGEYRRMGIATGLMQGHDAKFYTHSVDTVGGVFASKFNLKYNPFYLEQA